MRKLKAYKNNKSIILRFNPKSIIIPINPLHMINDKEIISMFAGLIKLIRQDERDIVIKEIKNSLTNRQK